MVSTSSTLTHRAGVPVDKHWTPISSKNMSLPASMPSHSTSQLVQNPGKYQSHIHAGDLDTMVQPQSNKELQESFKVEMKETHIPK